MREGQWKEGKEEGEGRKEEKEEGEMEEEETRGEEEEGEGEEKEECVGTAENTTCSSAKWLRTRVFGSIWILLLKSWKAPSHSPQTPKHQNPISLFEVTNVTQRQWNRKGAP